MEPSSINHNIILSVSLDDLDTIKAIAKQAIMDSVIASPNEKQDIIENTDSHVDKSFKEKDAIFLKYIHSDNKNEILGFIIIQDYWNLSDLFVAPKAHDKGIGKALWNVAKNQCRTKSNSQFIRVNSSMNAEGFYRRQGFIDCKPEKTYPDIIIPLIYNFSPAT